MKKRLNKEAYDKLSDDFKKLYKADGDNFVLDLEDDGDDDPTALKKALDAERKSRKELEKSLKEIKDKIEADERDKAGKTGDITALENSWKEKLATREKELTDIIGQRETSLRELLVDNEATRLASELSPKHAKLLLPHIKERLSAEFTDGKAMTRILKDGKPSAMSIDDLRKEFVANQDFSGIIVGSKGSGGGSGGPGNGGGGAGGTFDIKDYKNEDGSVNWQKVHLASKDNPDLVAQVQTAISPQPITV